MTPKGQLECSRNINKQWHVQGRLAGRVWPFVALCGRVGRSAVYESRCGCVRDMVGLSEMLAVCHSRR